MTTETCASLEGTTPGLYTYEVSSVLYLYLSVEGDDLIVVTTEDDVDILL